MKKIWIFFSLLFMGMIFCNNSEANLVIKNYNMGVKINEDSTYDVSEDIDVYFYAPMHGLYRSIPIRGNIYRNGEKPSKYRATISDIEVNKQYSANNLNSHDYIIKIGNPDLYVEHDQNYKIKYKYKVLEFSNKYDEVYYNLVGTSWENPIEKFSFTLTMPKEFNHNQVFFYDKNGDSKNVEYSITGNTISGSYNKELQPGEPFTIHILLPKGYFERTVLDYILPYLKFLPFLFPFIMFIIVFNLWYKYGKDEKTFEVVEFNPPENLDSVGIAYIYKQKISFQDVATLLISLANKGYLKIEEIKENILQTDYKYTKLKDYTENNSSEKIFFNALFSKGNSVTKNSLDDSTKLYTAAKNIIKKVEDSYPKTLYDKESLKWQKAVTWFMAFTWIAMAVYISLVTIPFIVIHLVVFPIVGYSIISTGIKNKEPFLLVFGTFWSLVSAAVLGVFIMLCDNTMIIPIIATLLLIIGMDIIKFYMPRWTITGNSLYGRVLGFKRFLEKVEIEKLQALVNNDPKYFYNIIPYAYVFGLEKKWFSKFEKLTCPPPDFYQGNAFNMHTFSSINSMLKSMGQSCTPPASSSGGGFGGGGGCGGGGCGGGGGGGW